MFKHFNLPFYMDVDDKGGASGDAKPKDEGTTETKVDWTKVNPADIPEDLLKKNPAYVKVLDETIQRRQEINKVLKPQLQSLQDQLNKLNPENAEEKTEVKPADTSDVPAWAKSIIEEFNTLKTTNVATWRDNAGKATGLKGTVLNSLSGSSYTEILAQATKIATELGITAPEADFSAGNPALERDKGFQEKVRNRITGKDAINTFDPEFQRSLGGGVVLSDS